MHTQRFVYSLLLASAAVVGLASSAHAGSFTLNDVYYGAADSYNNPPADVIGDSTFYITSAVVNRSGPGNDTLNIIINTNYAGAPGTNAADGTAYGSLFLTRGVWTPTGSAATNYSTDNYANASPNSNREWSYAVTNPTTGAVGTSNPATLYAIGAVGSASNYLSTGVPEYFNTADGKVYMSNVDGNPVSFPNTGHGNFYFRQGQAVQYVPTDPNQTVDAATFTVGAGFIEYSIVDNNLFGNTFALSWAMTCANDIIQGQVILGGGDLTGTPLPAALPLFAGGLGVMGLLARRRKRKGATARAA